MLALPTGKVHARGVDCSVLLMAQVHGKHVMYADDVFYSLPVRAHRQQPGRLMHGINGRREEVLRVADGLPGTMCCKSIHQDQDMLAAVRTTCAKNTSGQLA